MIPSVISTNPAGPELVPRPRAPKMRRAMSRPADRPRRTSRIAAVSKTATRAAATFRARKTRNDRRVASNGSTSPRTMPLSTYAKRSTDERGREGRRHDRDVGLPAERGLEDGAQGQLGDRHRDRDDERADDRPARSSSSSGPASLEPTRADRSGGRRGCADAIVRLSTAATRSPRSRSSRGTPTRPPRRRPGSTSISRVGLVERDDLERPTRERQRPDGAERSTRPM